MSKRNSQAAKSAARERLRAERERQAKKDRAKRQILVAVSVVGVLAIAGGVGYAVMQANQPDHWDTVKDSKEKVVKPANTEGKDGTTVVLGKDSAKKTLELYEDPRCPVCATFEQNNGEQIKKDLDAGKYKLQFFGATFLDGDNFAQDKYSAYGVGSKNALSALGAALNVSEDAFLDYKAAMYSTKHHPDEREDKFKDDSFLLDIAKDVPELKDNKKFQKAVEDGTFDNWAIAMSKDFEKAEGVEGTPTLKMDGKKLEATFEGGKKGTPLLLKQFNDTMKEALKG